MYYNSDRLTSSGGPDKREERNFEEVKDSLKKALNCLQDFVDAYDESSLKDKLMDFVSCFDFFNYLVFSNTNYKRNESPFIPDNITDDLFFEDEIMEDFFEDELFTNDDRIFDMMMIFKEIRKFLKKAYNKLGMI